jgi:hypothetical protein
LRGRHRARQIGEALRCLRAGSSLVRLAGCCISSLLLLLRLGHGRRLVASIWRRCIGRRRRIGRGLPVVAAAFAHIELVRHCLAERRARTKRERRMNVPALAVCVGARLRACPSPAAKIGQKCRCSGIILNRAALGRDVFCMSSCPGLQVRIRSGWFCNRP